MVVAAATATVTVVAAMMTATAGVAALMAMVTAMAAAMTVMTSTMATTAAKTAAAILMVKRTAMMLAMMKTRAMMTMTRQWHHAPKKNMKNRGTFVCYSLGCGTRTPKLSALVFVHGVGMTPMRLVGASSHHRPW